jgi:predicted RNA-binding protein with PIN domain
MTLIIDGNNVMGSRPDGWWRDRAAAAIRLADAIAAWADGSRSVVIVFDGHAPAGHATRPGIDVRYADRPGRDAADDLIAELVATAGDPTAIEVVTSDAGLAGRVRAHGAHVRGARGFRDEIDGGA